VKIFADSRVQHEIHVDYPQKLRGHGLCFGEFKPGWQRFTVAWYPYKFCHASLKPLLTSMDFVHESTTPEAGLLPLSVGLVLDCIGMVRPIPIGIETRRGGGSGWWFRRFVGSHN
jgi:hypothetical protein